MPALPALRERSTLTSNTQITSEECGDLAVTAAEGGIGYWAQMETYEWRRWHGSDNPADALPVADDFVYYTIHALSEDESEFNGPAVDVTPALIKRGFGLYREQGRTLDTDGPSYLDADAADVIVQLGVYGKVVYG